MLLALLSRLAFADPTAAQSDAQHFLDQYNSLYLSIATIDNNASWDASTDVNDINEGRRTASGQALAAFLGDAQIVANARALLTHKAELTPLQVKQLEAVVFDAGVSPASIPDVVNARIAAESKQAAVQDAFVYCLETRAADGSCAAPKTANDINEILLSNNDLAARKVAWDASKQIGVPLKSGLADLVKLRNQVARESGYSSYFGYMVSDYGMTVPEMMALLDGFVADTAPLYRELQKWSSRQYAGRYHAALPTGPVPAHWIGNRWAQEWPGLVAATDLDPYFKDRQPEWIVKQAESFYVSIGFPALPPSFWQKSDLYPVPAGQSRHKNSHASAWHVDVRNDIRSLMSVEPNAEWFGTAHHELGHIYYYVSYSRPEVPPILREGANRAFHEGVGELINVAAGQTPYLKQIGILPAKLKVDPMQHLLAEAIEQTVVFMPFAAGTMSHFEYELYEKNLPPEQWQKRWWEMTGQYQNVAAPDASRLTDTALCDACTKTHINDDPAGYYDYALATVIKYQLHEHIAAKILKQDPHACNYYGNKEVGNFLRGILEKGATEDWRKVLKDATGEELSTRAMVDYFKPLQGWLEKENKKAR